MLALQAIVLALIEVEGLALERKFYRIHHKSRNFNPLGLAFIDFCQGFLNTES